jgi:site-specific DNA-methyltransferase (adenine-specific)
MLYNLMNGNSLELLKTLEDNSVDAIVTDPPYGLSQHSQGDIVNALTAWLAGEEYTHGKAGFMGKAWDSFVPSPMLFKECYRVLKHGGHILCFAGSRTQDLMSLSIRLAGFEMRDACLWLYGSGFPKGLDVAKGIDKEMGFNDDERPIIGKNPAYRPNEYNWVGGAGGKTPVRPQFKTGNVSDQAKQWEGWNTNLKPAYEPIIMARKPLDGTVVNNVLKHGVGGLNIDACRISTSEDDLKGLYRATRENNSERSWKNTSKQIIQNPVVLEKGRYPANIILDGSDSVEALFPYSKSGSGQKNQFNSKGSACGFYKNNLKPTGREWQGSEGSASRYFYHAKASKADRDEGLEGFELKKADLDGEGRNPAGFNSADRKPTLPMFNTHPTVKPTQLMRYLVKLVTPHGGLVLDPFMGSGSTGKACMLEGMRFIGMDLNEEYVKIAESRIEHASQKMSLLNYEEID